MSHIKDKQPSFTQFTKALGEPADLFLEQLAVQKNYSKLTLQNYRRQLNKLLRFLLENNLESWSAVKPIHVRQLSAYHHRKGLKPKSIALLLSACRSFFNYLVDHEQISFNPAKGVRSPKINRSLPKTIDVDQLCALLNGIDLGEDIGIRDKAIAEFFYSSGLRLAELVRLNVNDLDLKAKEARIVGKGNKTRLVPIGHFAFEAIRQWLKVRSVWLGSNNGTLTDSDNALFVTQRYSRLSPRAIQARMEYWGKQIGLNGRLHPHRFRHSCATHMLESSGDLRAIQELLGHADIATTQVYTHLDFQKLAAVYDVAHPRAKKPN